MRICHVVPSLQEQHGGPSKSVRALCQELASTGSTIDLLTTDPAAPRNGNLIREGGLNINVFHRDAPQRLCASSGLKSALETTDADIIHHHALWLRTLHYAHLAAARRQVPLVLSPRGMMSRWAWNHHSMRKGLARTLLHPGALEAVAGWHVTSNEEADDVRELGFGGPVCIAPNGVDAPDAITIKAARAYWHDACPATRTQPTAIFYGRFHHKKRVLELIDAWAEWAAPEWLLLVVGVPEEYSPEMLEQNAEKVLAGGRVRAFSGLARPAPYAVASLFVLPSHNENFGLVVAEAMAWGLPALVTDTTPWRALNTEDRGWCVPWTEYARVLAAATRESPQRLQARGRGAREWAIREFSWKRSATQLHEFYDKLREQGR